MHSHISHLIANNIIFHLKSTADKFLSRKREIQLLETNFGIFLHTNNLIQSVYLKDCSLITY